MDLAQSTTVPKMTNIRPELNDIRLQLDRDPNQQRPPRLQDSTVQPVHISTTNDTTLTHVLESGSTPVLVSVGTPYGAPTSGITITIPQQTQQCYPTEQALQAKAKRKQVKEEQGISGRQQQKATKTNKYVEEHYDDCGGDFTPLMPTTAASYYDDHDEYFFDYYDTQHKFFTSVDLQF